MPGELNTSTIRLQREVFLGALERSDPQERADFLDSACGADIELRRAVELLLQEQASVGAFLEGSAWSVGKAQPTAHGSGACRTEQLGDQIGPYWLRQQLGDGGCGVVYLAQQEKPFRREVALKIIKLGMDTREVIARFEAERQTLALMNHPNIARVFDAGATSAGRPFFVMELVRGVKLTEYCNEQCLSIAERLRLFIQVCQGIQHAHQKGVIHRDIKPSNILVAHLDGRAVPKIIDFGIARAIRRPLSADETQVTSLGQLIGTPAYMSPEQASMNGLDIDTRSDIYSLGVLLFELLVGRTPFAQDAILKHHLDWWRRIVREQEPGRPSARLAALPKQELLRVARQRRADPGQLVSLFRKDLDWITLKALEKDRTRRYPTASALAQDLEYYLADEPVLARPPSKVYRFTKLVQRHRPVFAALVLLAAVLVLGSGISAWLAIRAKRAETDARLSEKMEVQLRRQAERERERATAQADLARLNEYVADINLAQESLNSGNYGRAVQLLKKHAAPAGAGQLRGFEWRYLWQLSRGDEHSQLPNQGAAVRVLAISPSGQWLAVGTEKKLNLWDLPHRTLVRSWPVHAVSAVFCAAGRELAFSDPAEVRIMDLGAGTETTLTNTPGGIIACSPDGSRLAVAGRDGVRLWNTESWEVQASLPDARAPLAFSPDGKFLATGTVRGITVWQLGTGTAAAVLRNSRRIARPRFWDLLGCALCFSPDGSWLFAARSFPSAEDTFAVRVWNARTGEEAGTIPPDNQRGGHTGMIAWLECSPDGNLLATASMDHSVRLWDLRSRQALWTLHGHLSEVWTCVFSPDDKTLITGAKDGSVNLWAIPPKAERNVLRGPYEPVAFSPDSRSLAVVDRQHAVLCFFDPLTHEKTGEVPLSRNSFRGPGRLQLSADLAVIAQADATGEVRVHQLAKDQTVELQAGPGPLFELALSPNAEQLVTGGFGRSLQWWNIARRSHIELGAGRRSPLFSPDSRTLLVIAASERAELWDTGNHSVRTVLSGDSPLGSAAAFSPDGHVVAIASAPLNPEQTISLWDTATGKALGACVGHKQGIHGLAFSADGRTLASTSDDGTLKLWNVSSLQQLLSFRIPARATHPIFSPDGNWLAVDQVGFPERGIVFYSGPSPQQEPLNVGGIAFP